jgi:hydroxymethylbilane synthase
LRRATQLLLARPDLVVAPLRGNVDTRLRKLDQGELDAIVLAKAGLLRLDLALRATETIDPSLVIPAPGQGALAIECRAADRATRDVLAALSDVETEVAVACERGVMKAVGGNCDVPFGAHAVRRIGELALLAFLAEVDGQGPRRVERVVPWPETTEEAERVGREAGKALLGPPPTTS